MYPGRSGDFLWGGISTNDNDRDGTLLNGDAFQEGMNTEDGSCREETIYYDIRVNAVRIR